MICKKPSITIKFNFCWIIHHWKFSLLSKTFTHHLPKALRVMVVSICLSSWVVSQKQKNKTLILVYTTWSIDHNESEGNLWLSTSRSSGAVSVVVCIKIKNFIWKSFFHCLFFNQESQAIYSTSLVYCLKLFLAFGIHLFLCIFSVLTNDVQMKGAANKERQVKCNIKKRSKH